MMVLSEQKRLYLEIQQMVFGMHYGEKLQRDIPQKQVRSQHSAGRPYPWKEETFLNHLLRLLKFYQPEFLFAKKHLKEAMVTKLSKEEVHVPFNTLLTGKPLVICEVHLVIDRFDTVEPYERNGRIYITEELYNQLQRGDEIQVMCQFSRHWPDEVRMKLV